MLNQNITFKAGDMMTPDIAAKIAQRASMFEAKVYIHHRGMDLCVDSLIGILALNVRKGSEINVGAEGSDEAAALKAICDILEGK